MLMQPSYGAHMSQWQGGMIWPVSQTTNTKLDSLWRYPAFFKMFYGVAPCCPGQLPTSAAHKELFIFLMHSKQNRIEKQCKVWARGYFWVIWSKRLHLPSDHYRRHVRERAHGHFVRRRKKLFSPEFVVHTPSTEVFVKKKKKKMERFLL